MTYCMADYLKVMEPYISHKLISGNSMSEIKKIARIMPPASRFGFESRLGDKTARADFLLAIAPSDGSRSIFAGQNGLVSLPDALWSHPEWRHVRHFCLEWAKPTSIFHRSVHVIWLEFDIDAPLPEVPIPSLFFNFVPSDKNCLEVIENAWQSIFNQLPIKPLRDNLHLCFAALPAGGRISDVGFMFSRQVEALRLVVDLSPKQLLPYLARIGWPGSLSELEPLIQPLSSLAGRLGLGIDLSHTILPKIGLEGAIYTNQDPDVKAERLLDYLVENELCTSDKRDALLSWIGTVDERLSPERWPTFLQKASEQLGSHIVSAFVRALHHIKVVYQPGKPLEAKGYWGSEHFWVRTNNQSKVEVQS